MLPTSQIRYQLNRISGEDVDMERMSEPSHSVNFTQQST